jgi:energy-coupling factor transporter ATP-binding protein EcfA2
MQKEDQNSDAAFEGLYSYKGNVIQMGLMDIEFYNNPIGIPAFHALTNTDGDSKEKQKAYKNLVCTKHIPHISRIDYVGDINSNNHHYNVDSQNGIITVQYAPIQPDIKDKKVIEDYLEDRFGQYKDFIKEYLAVYSHTNYRKLPTLVLKGPRGNGKSTFADMVGSIYEPLSTDWSGIESDFTYEVEKKFLIVEENTTSDKKQYETLKKYTGRAYSTVKKKFRDPYKVLNNMAIVVISNEPIPLFVESSEAPKDEKNNQFFVWEFPEVKGELNNNKLSELQSRLGHYIRTELKEVFEKIKLESKYRYSINVPITDYEKALFEDNISDIELEANELVNSLCSYKKANDDSNNFFPLLDKGWLPSEFVKNRFQRNHHEIIKQLKKQCLLEGGAIAKWNGIRKPSSYKMTKKLIGLFTKGQKEL